MTGRRSAFEFRLKTRSTSTRLSRTADGLDECAGDSTPIDMGTRGLPPCSHPKSLAIALSRLSHSRFGCRRAPFKYVTEVSELR